MTDIAEGAPAPDFTLETADGPVRLADFKGKTLVLYFYPKDDTPGCTREAQDFTALAPEFAKAGASVVGVSRLKSGAAAPSTISLIKELQIS